VHLKGYACSAALVALAAAAIPVRTLPAQQAARDSTVLDSIASAPAAGDSLAAPRAPLSMRLRKDTLFLERSPVFGDFGRFGGAREASGAVARRRTDALQSAAALRQSALWGTTLREAFAPRVLPDSGVERQLAAQPPELQPPGIVPPSPLLTDTVPSTARRDSLPDAMRAAGDLLGQYADLGLQFYSPSSWIVRRRLISKFLKPFGVFTFTSSPSSFPSIAWPMGETVEILPCSGSLSSEVTSL
jgi:hypothetical protein